MYCTLYRSAAKDVHGMNVNMWSVLEAIKHGRWAEHVMYVREGKMEKIWLPGATFSGTFSYRSDSSMETHTGVMVMDVDKVRGVGVLKETIRRDKSCLATFSSPSGKGLKALFLTRSSKNEHRGYYKAVMKWFESTFNVKADPKNKNPSRLCFISYDPEMHINYDAVPMDITPERPKAIKPKKINVDGADTFNTCKQMTERRCPNVEGNRNNHVHLLACHLNRMGVSFDEALHNIEQTSDLSFKEIKATVRGVYQRNQYEHGTWSE